MHGMGMLDFKVMICMKYEILNVKYEICMDNVYVGIKFLVMKSSITFIL